MELPKKHALRNGCRFALPSNPINSARIAENVQRGDCPFDHSPDDHDWVSDHRDRDNILDERFSRFGTATATGKDDG
jgi:hypothetical protein